MKALASLVLLFVLGSPALIEAQILAAGAPPPPDLGQGAEEIPNWKARWELAKLLSYGKRYSESLNEYRRLLQEKPDLAAARAEMAQVLSWSGQNAEALKILEGLSREELEPQARLTLADLLMAQKRYPQAEELLRQHLAGSPEDFSVRLKLAELLSWDKRYDASLAEYRRILQAKPEDIQVRRKYAFVLIWAGQREQAMAELRKTLPAGQPPAKP